MIRFVCSCGVSLIVAYVFLADNGSVSAQDKPAKALSEKAPAVPKQTTWEEDPDREAILRFVAMACSIPWIYEVHLDDVKIVCEKIANNSEPESVHWKCMVCFTERKTWLFGLETRQRNRTEVVYVQMSHYRAAAK